MIKTGDNVWVKHSLDSWVPATLVELGAKSTVRVLTTSRNLEKDEMLEVKRTSDVFASMGALDIGDCNLDGKLFNGMRASEVAFVHRDCHWDI